MIALYLLNIMQSCFPTFLNCSTSPENMKFAAEFSHPLLSLSVQYILFIIWLKYHQNCLLLFIWFLKFMTMGSRRHSSICIPQQHGVYDIDIPSADVLSLKNQNKKTLPPIQYSESPTLRPNSHSLKLHCPLPNVQKAACAWKKLIWSPFHSFLPLVEEIDTWFYF